MKRPVTVRLTILLLLASATLLAQKPTLVTVTLPDSASAAYIDRPGELYIQTQNGQLHRYDKDGNLKATAHSTTPPTLFDPRDGARLFAYYRDKQQYTYLNPFFEAGTFNPIDAAFAAEPWLVCASGDYNIWVLDAADWSLKKIDTQKGVVLVEAPVTSLAADKRQTITYLREYQGFLFLLERGKALHIYSGMGKHLRTLDAPGIRYFNVLGEEVYYDVNGKRQSINLFDDSHYYAQGLPNHWSFELMSDERLYRINGKILEVNPLSKP